MRKRPNDVEKLDQISQSINPDGKGNLTIGKNLGVDGKLKLKSLVSASNPDGDITKELGGGGGGGGSSEKLYCHSIAFASDSNSKGGYIMLNYYSKKKDKFTYNTFKKEFDKNKQLACSGYIHDGDKFFTPLYIQLASNGPFTEINVRYFDSVRNMYDLTGIHWFSFGDNVSEVI